MEELRACDCGAVDRLAVECQEFRNDSYNQSHEEWQAWTWCQDCERSGPMCYAPIKSAAIAAAIAGWNHRPEEERLRAALVQARDMLQKHPPIARETGGGHRWCTECGSEVRPAGRMECPDDCEYQQALADIDAALGKEG